MSLQTDFDPAFRQARARMALLKKEVDEEPWNRPHAEAMKCLTLENTLEVSVDLYDAALALDQQMRGAVLRGEWPSYARYEKRIRDVFEAWLGLGKRLEKVVAAFERRRLQVKHAGEFRRRRKEAIWMLKPASEACGHPRMVAARDAALA